MRTFRVLGNPFRSLGNPGGAGFMPYIVNFANYGDGALPSPFLGSTWTIASGKAKNTPTLGSELVPNPGLEGTYVSGVAPNLTKSGSPTVAEDTATPHGGTSAQSFIAAAANNLLQFAGADAVAGVNEQWYQHSAWAIRTAGSSLNSCLSANQTGMLPDNVEVANASYNSASYQQFFASFLSVTTNAINMRPIIELGSAGGNTILVDDVSLKTVTYSSIFAMLPATQPNVIWKIQPDTIVAGDSTVFGLILRANAQTSPTSQIYVLMHRQARSATGGIVWVMKRVSGTTSPVLSQTGITLAANAYLEGRLSGNTLQVFYNGIQVGGDQTIGDAAIVSNAYHGMFSLGSNAIKAVSMVAN